MGLHPVPRRGPVLLCLRCGPTAVRPPPHLQIFAGPLKGGDRAAVLANFQTTQSQYPISNITVFWEQLGLPADARCAVRDLYGERDLGVWQGSFSAAVPVHDVAVLRVGPVDGPRDDAWRPWHAHPLYAAQPANLAAAGPGDWIAGYSGAAGAQQQQRQQQQHGSAQQQEEQQWRSGLPSVPSGKGPPSIAMVLSVVAALGALCVLGYYVTLHMRLRGWTSLSESSNARKAAELAAQLPEWRNHIGVSNVAAPVAAPKP